MLKKITTWIKEKTCKIGRYISNNHRRGAPEPPKITLEIQKAVSSGATSFQYLLNDPTTPSLVKSTIPMSSTTDLPFTVVGYSSTPTTAVQIQAAGVATTLNNSKRYMQGMIARSRSRLSRWPGTKNLNVLPRAGVDFNAYYDRRNLKFFYDTDTTTNKVVYCADSVDIVAHEFGHALLDAMRPDLWSSMALEVWAFHEAFADINGILTLMQYDEVLQYAIDETAGELTGSNVLSRCAEELGIAVYHVYNGASDGSLSNALRDASVRYDYVRPETLPDFGRDDVLTSEPHSFSRVFSGCFWAMLVAVYQQKKETTDRMTALKYARDTMAAYLTKAVPIAAKGNRFYGAVCRAILAADKAKDSVHQEVIKGVMDDRKILTGSLRSQGSKKWDDVRGNLLVNDEVMKTSKVLSVRLNRCKAMKLGESTQALSALSAVGPDLSSVNIEIPMDHYYEFDQNGSIVHEEAPDIDSAINEAVVCVNYLKKKDRIGPGKMWDVKTNRLTRSRIVCNCHHIGCPLW